jgi:methionyl-tRNA synthetase
MSEPKVTTLIVAPPTTNGPLHLGHLSGSYLACDVISRMARGRGERVLSVGGFDTHPNWVLTKAENDGIDVEKVIQEYRQRIDKAMQLARIEPDVCIDPQEADHQAAIVRLANYLAGKAFPLREFTLSACEDCGRTLHNSYVSGLCSRCGAGCNGSTCEGCGGFTSAQNLLNPKCARCGGAPRPFQARIPVLALEDFREQFIEIWLRMEQPRRIRDLLADYLANGLPEMPLAFPTNWGLEGTGLLAGLRLDVNFELGLNGYQCVAKGIDPTLDSVEAAQAAWRQVGKVWHIHGLDNGFYSALMWPAIFTALGVEPAQHGGSIVNEWYTLDGLKFSTSRNHAIWVDDLLAVEDAEIVRLYLAWDGPDRYQSNFTMAGYQAFRERVAPLLDGTVAADPLPAPLATADLARAFDALRPQGYDPGLAVRCLLANLGGTAARAEVELLRQALGGRDSGVAQECG